MNDILNIGLESPPSLEPTNAEGKSRRKITDGGRFTSIGLPPPSEDSAPHVKRKPRHRKTKQLAQELTPHIKNRAARGMPEYLPGQAVIGPATEGEIDSLYESRALPPVPSLPTYGMVDPAQVDNERNFVISALSAKDEDGNQLYGQAEIQKKLVERRRAKEFRPIELTENRPVDQSIFAPLEDMAGVDRGGLKDAEEILANISNISNRHETFALQLGGLASDDLQQKYLRRSGEEKEKAVKVLRFLGVNAFYDPQSGDFRAMDIDGNAQVIEESLFESILESSGETVGAVGGLIAGGLVGARKGASIPLPVPLRAASAILGGIVGLAGGAAGSSAGASVGSMVDYARNSMQLSQQLDLEVMWDKAVDAGAADIAYTVLGAGVVKIGAKPANLIYKKFIARAWDKVSTGNEVEALEFLKKKLNISDEKAKEITTQWLRTLKNPTGQTTKVGFLPRRPLSEAKKQMVAIVDTQPGAELFTGGLVNLDSTWIRTNGDKTAKQLISATDGLITDNRVLRDSATKGTVTKDGILKLRGTMAEYSKGVKEARLDVEYVPVNTIDDKSNFRFNIKEHTTDITKAYTKRSPINPEAFRKFSTLIDSLEAEASDSFANLLLLRDEVSIFKGKTTADTYIQGALNKSLDKIDNTLYEAVEEHLGKELADAWSQSHQRVLKEEVEMLEHKNNILSKAILAPGATEDDIAKNIVKYLHAIDDTGATFMSKLSPNSKSRVDGILMQELIKKHSKEVQGVEAVDFRGLVKDLDKYEFTNSNAIKLKEFAIKYGDSMGNDVALSANSGGLRAGKPSQALTTNLWEKLKFLLASRTFTYALQFLPGADRPYNSLMYNLHQSLGNNYDRKAVKELVELTAMKPSGEALPINQELEATIRELDTEYALSGMDPEKFLGDLDGASIPGPYVDRPKVRAYVVGRGATAADRVEPSEDALAGQLKYTTGPLNKKSAGLIKRGSLGKGYYAKATVTEEDRVKFPSTKISSKLIEKDKIADISDINRVINDGERQHKIISLSELAGSNSTQDRAARLLKSKGYEGITDGNIIMIFDLKE